MVSSSWNFIDKEGRSEHGAVIVSRETQPCTWIQKRCHQDRFTFWTRALALKWGEFSPLKLAPHFGESAYLEMRCRYHTLMQLSLEMRRRSWGFKYTIWKISLLTLRTHWVRVKKTSVVWPPSWQRWCVFMEFRVKLKVVSKPGWEKWSACTTNRNGGKKILHWS